MKSRSGFVSNSSTSSFILVGFEITSDDFEGTKYEGSELETYEIAEEVGLEYQYDGEIMGKYVASWDDYDTTSFEFSVNELNDLKVKVEEGMKKLGLEKEIKFFAGTRQSWPLTIE